VPLPSSSACTSNWQPRRSAAVMRPPGGQFIQYPPVGNSARHAAPCPGRNRTEGNTLPLLRIGPRSISNAISRRQADRRQRRFGLEDLELGEQYAGQTGSVTDPGTCLSRRCQILGLRPQVLALDAAVAAVGQSHIARLVRLDLDVYRCRCYTRSGQLPGRDANPIGVNHPDVTRLEWPMHFGRIDYWRPEPLASGMNSCARRNLNY
jgi:hypothetical protein